MPDAGAGRLRDADRDVLAVALGTHYAEGRIDASELDRRLDLVLGALTAADAAIALDGLPASAPAPEPRGRRRWGGGRHGEADAAAAGWVPTPERFIDPTTRRVMRVWRDAGDGARHYVPEA